MAVQSELVRNQLPVMMPVDPARNSGSIIQPQPMIEAKPLTINSEYYKSPIDNRTNKTSQNKSAVVATPEKKSAVNNKNSEKLAPQEIDAMVDEMFAKSKLVETPAPEISWDATNPLAEISKSMEFPKTLGTKIPLQEKQLKSEQPLTVEKSSARRGTFNASAPKSVSPKKPSAKLPIVDALNESSGALLEIPDLRPIAPVAEPTQSKDGDANESGIPSSRRQYIPFTMPNEKPALMNNAEPGQFSPIPEDGQSQQSEPATGTRQPIPRLQARPVDKSSQRKSGVPVSNASHGTTPSHAAIIPEPSGTLFIPPSAIQPVPATGPEIESKTFPGFRGLPVPNSKSLEPRSAQPGSNEMLR
jgi:hypothetical protein